ELLNEFRPKSRAEADRVLDEINHRLNGPDLPEETREALLRQARLVDFRKNQRPGGPDVDAALFPGPDGRLQLECRLEVPKVKPQRELSAYDQANPPLLFFDEPAASLDWSHAGGRKTLKGLVDTGAADVYE